jgi:hypothetical protein
MHTRLDGRNGRRGEVEEERVARPFRFDSRTFPPTLTPCKEDKERDEKAVTRHTCEVFLGEPDDGVGSLLLPWLTVLAWLEVGQILVEALRAPLILLSPASGRRCGESTQASKRTQPVGTKKEKKRRVENGCGVGVRRRRQQLGTER